MNNEQMLLPTEAMLQAAVLAANGYSGIASRDFLHFVIGETLKAAPKEWNTRAAQPQAVEGLPERKSAGNFIGYRAYESAVLARGFNEAIDECQAAFAAVRAENTRIGEHLGIEVARKNDFFSKLQGVTSERNALQASNTKMADCLKALRSPMADLPHWRDGVALIDEALAANGGQS